MNRLCVFAVIVALLGGSGCGVLKKKESPDVDVSAVVQKPLPPEKTEELLSEVGSNWLYGSGVGSTAITAGSIFVFPPYALYVLGNGILSVSGYEPLYVTDVLPDQEREGWNSVYDTVTGAPGKVTAAVAGKEFRTQEVAKERVNAILSSVNDEKASEKKIASKKIVSEKNVNDTSHQ